MCKAKRKLLTRTTVIIVLLCITIILWLRGWLHPVLLTIAAIAALFLIVLFIWMGLIKARIDREKKSGNLDRWLSDLGLSKLSVRKTGEIFARLLQIRDDPRISEEDRNHAAFLTRTSIFKTRGGWKQQGTRQ